MRFPSRLAIVGALVLSPAAAMAWVWPFAPPSLPEDAAVAIAMDQGVMVIDDIDGTLDADWHIRGKDAWGNEVELVIDGETGAIERAEMDAE
jgi:Peptidase propeptide and YPEB domain